MKCDYKKAIDHNKRSGVARKEIRHKAKLDIILGEGPFCLTLHLSVVILPITIELLCTKYIYYLMLLCYLGKVNKCAFL